MFATMGNNLPIRATTALAGGEYATQIAQALRRELGNSRRTIKTLMRWTGVSERTAKNWLAAKRGPSGLDLLILGKYSDEVLLAMAALMGRAILARSLDASRLERLLTDALGTLKGEAYADD